MGYHAHIPALIMAKFGTQEATADQWLIIDVHSRAKFVSIGATSCSLTVKKTQKWPNFEISPYKEIGFIISKIKKNKLIYVADVIQSPFQQSDDRC